MPFKRDNPGCACCCLDGQYCLKVHGCSPGIVGGPFHVEIFDGATMVASGDAGPASFTCFDLPGNKRYTRVITADRYRTDTATFDAPCSDVAWEIDETVNMQPADGYVCACTCPDPLRLPLTMNDGFGDVTLEETGGLTFGGACALRPVAQGIENCDAAGRGVVPGRAVRRRVGHPVELRIVHPGELLGPVLAVPGGVHAGPARVPDGHLRRDGDDRGDGGGVMRLWAATAEVDGQE
jgi:hypothetical protein